MDTFRKWLNKPKVRLLTLNIVHSMYASVCVCMCECVTYIKTTIAPDNLIYICVDVCTHAATQTLVLIYDNCSYSCIGFLIIKTKKQRRQYENKD